MVYWFGMVGNSGPRRCRDYHGSVALHLCQCRHEIRGLLLRRLPAIWNVVVLYFYILETALGRQSRHHRPLVDPHLHPDQVVHPLRVTDWREITIPVTVLWAAMTLSLVISGKDEGPKDLVYQLQLWAWVAASCTLPEFPCGGPS